MTHDTALNIDSHQNYTQNINFYLTENTVYSRYKDQPFNAFSGNNCLVIVGFVLKDINTPYSNVQSFF